MSILSCSASEVSSSNSSSAGEGGGITVAVEVCLSSGDAALE